MLITFAGSSHSKYTGYLLDTIGFLECDTDQELRTMFLQNWLVNPSGEPGRHIEKDLMQEHHNEVLEENVKRKGMDWDSKPMRDVHSRTVEHVKRIKREQRTALALSPKGWKHTKPHDRPEIKILLSVYCTTQLHKFRQGRQYQSSSCFVDEFTQGVERLEEKLVKWKTDLIHSDIITTTRPQALEALSLENEQPEGDPDGPADDGDEAGDGEEEDIIARVTQTGGHSVFVDGELHIVGNEIEHDEDYE